MRMFFYFFLASTLFIQNTHADGIDSDIQKVVQNCREFNGIVLVSQEQRILCESVTGYSDYEKRTPLTINNQFIIGSISKQITAVLVLRAVEDGRISLHLPISKFLPSLQDDWANVVTIHHLLTHTSGIKSLGAPLQYQPGERFEYSNLGYDLLGQILENMTGKSYAVLVDEFMQKNCDLYETMAPPSGSLSALRNLLPKLADGCLEYEEGVESIQSTDREQEHNPSGGIISTAHEMLRWNECLHNGHALLPDSYTLFITPSVERNHRWGKVSYGYGVQIKNDNGILEISHNGYVPGYCSTLIYYPLQKISLIILENKTVWTKEWTIPDQIRCYATHDAIRKIVHKYIANNLQT